MRWRLGWLGAALLAAGCNVATPVFPTSDLSNATRNPAVTTGNWTPYYFPNWRPGQGLSLGLGIAAESVVVANDLCVPDVRVQWDARASCRRFVVSIPADGVLHVQVRWDITAPAFKLALAGEVVLVAQDGNMAVSEGSSAAVEASAPVTAGSYDVLVMSYGDGSVPFQIRADLRRPVVR